MCNSLTRAASSRLGVATEFLQIYGGFINLAEFLQIYSNTIFTSGGDQTVMMNYFHVALTGSTQSWLMNLPRESIHSWEEDIWQ
jgi:hypothetical protein